MTDRKRRRFDCLIGTLRNLKTLSPVLILIVAAGFSCAVVPAPAPANAAMNLPDSIPKDPAAIEQMAQDFKNRGDLATADALLLHSLDDNEGLSRSWEIRLRGLRLEIRKEYFLDNCPIGLEIWTRNEVKSFSDEVALEFRIHNRSPEPFTIPSRNAWSWLPFTESRQSLISVNISITDVGMRDGVITGGSWNEILPMRGSLEIPPGKSGDIAFTMELTPTPGLNYRRIEIDAELIPGGLEFADHDYGIMRFVFPKRTLHFFEATSMSTSTSTPPAMAAAGSDAIAEALDAGDRMCLLRTAVLLPERDRPECIDYLVQALPSLPRDVQNMTMTVLTLLTRENLGYDVHRWLNWWRQETGRNVETGNGPESESVERRAEVSRRNPRSGGGFGTVSSLLALICATVSPSPGISQDSSSAEYATMATTQPFDRQRADFDLEPHEIVIRSELSSPYSGRRGRNIDVLAASGEDALPLIERLLAAPEPRVRRGAIAALKEIGGARSIELLVKTLECDTDRGVRQMVIQALGRLEQPLPSLPDHLRSEERSILLELYIDNRLMIAMEEVMHDGMVPGFYDGQFQSFFRIASDIPERLAKIAVDEDVHYIARVLAIMSLNEKPTQNLEGALAALILPARDELQGEWYIFYDSRRPEGSNENLIVRNRRLGLSRFARFALAKAGVDKYVGAKIRAMEKWVRDNGVLIDRDKTFKEIFGTRLLLKKEFSRSLFFEIGYEFQQCDDFDDAERWYLKLIKSFDDSFALSSAHYNLACLYSLQGKIEAALLHVTKATENGFLDFAWMDEDRDLDQLRNDPRYGALKQKVLNDTDSEETPAEDGDHRP